ncbi:MAG: ribonuclease H-like domain-containing protein [Bacteroidetes bacterium]|nr:ribonuclease H-like domain-containing protein [Bacteroidota bacterium]MBU2584422.1 ribonuclease H-like domain-containing protein [Bacteroidota bacterium]
MLFKTYSHIKSIGPKTEKILWSNGITDWDTFLRTENLPLSEGKKIFIKASIIDSKIRLLQKNGIYFTKHLQTNQHWRLFKEFKDSTVYLDIETTGLSPLYNKITTIATYDGNEIKYYVNGRNLDDFIEDINKYSLIVTYNGKCFDVPFIEEYLKIRLNKAHIDLRYVLHSLGYSGGLKGCEKQFGLSRNELEGVDGFMAVYLWIEYEKHKNDKALETLLAYNIEDVVNLEFLMHSAYNLKIKETPFESTCSLKIPERPEIPLRADVGIVKEYLKVNSSGVSIRVSLA